MLEKHEMKIVVFEARDVWGWANPSTDQEEGEDEFSIRPVLSDW